MKDSMSLQQESQLLKENDQKQNIVIINTARLNLDSRKLHALTSIPSFESSHSTSISNKAHLNLADHSQNPLTLYLLEKYSNHRIQMVFF